MSEYEHIKANELRELLTEKDRLIRAQQYEQVAELRDRERRWMEEHLWEQYQRKGKIIKQKQPVWKTY